MKASIKSSLFSFIILGLIGCGSGGPQFAGNGQEAIYSGNIEEALVGRWQLVSLNGQEATENAQVYIFSMAEMNQDGGLDCSGAAYLAVDQGELYPTGNLLASSQRCFVEMDPDSEQAKVNEVVFGKYANQSISFELTSSSLQIDSLEFVPITSP